MGPKARKKLRVKSFDIGRARKSEESELEILDWVNDFCGDTTSVRVLTRTVNNKALALNPNFSPEPEARDLEDTRKYRNKQTSCKRFLKKHHISVWDDLAHTPEILYRVAWICDEGRGGGRSGAANSGPPEVPLQLSLRQTST